MSATSDLSLPSALMPLDTFKERMRALGLRPREEQSGGTDTAVLDTSEFRLCIRHSGYGGGFGGPRPVRVLSFRVERPSAPPGSLVAEDAQRRAVGVLRALTAPAPPVHDYHPDAIRLRIMAFCAEAEIKRCRIVMAEHALRDRLRGHSMEERFMAYARAAAELSTDLTVYRLKSPPPWPILFRGGVESLAGRLPELRSAIGESAIRIEAGTAPRALSIEDPFTIAHDTLRLLSERISNAKREGRFTRLEVDADVVTPLTLASDVDVPAVKGQLEALARAAESFAVEVDGTSRETKRSKLASLATSLRAAVRAGKRVTIRPLGVRTVGTELEV